MRLIFRQRDKRVRNGRREQEKESKTFFSFIEIKESWRHQKMQSAIREMISYFFFFAVPVQLQLALTHYWKVFMTFDWMFWGCAHIKNNFNNSRKKESSNTSCSSSIIKELKTRTNEIMPKDTSVIGLVWLTRSRLLLYCITHKVVPSGASSSLTVITLNVDFWKVQIYLSSVSTGLFLEESSSHNTILTSIFSSRS